MTADRIVPADDRASTDRLTPRKPVSQLNEYGPFLEHTVVPTEYGEFGVPAGQVMHFELRERWDPKEQKQVEQMWPVYEKVLMDTDKLQPSEGLSRMRGQQVRKPNELNLTAADVIEILDQRDAELVAERLAKENAELRAELAKARKERKTKPKAKVASATPLWDSLTEVQKVGVATVGKSSSLYNVPGVGRVRGLEAAAKAIIERDKETSNGNS